jgi:hypothetical protein
MADKPELDKLEPHQRPLGRILADAHGGQYLPLRSLAEAKSVAGGVVILQGDDGGQIYVVARAADVSCAEEILYALLHELDGMAWRDPDMCRIYYERLPLGAGVSGGMGGGQVEETPWVHKEFVKRRLKDKIVAVLKGQRDRVR